MYLLFVGHPLLHLLIERDHPNTSVDPMLLVVSHSQHSRNTNMVMFVLMQVCGG